MSSIKTVLRKKPNANGQFPIFIRITVNRKSSFLSLGQYVDLKHWDDKSKQVKKSHPNYKRLNHLIAHKLAEANEKLLEIETREDFSSAQHVKKEIERKNESFDFFSEGEKYLKEILLQKKYSRYNADKPRLKHFKDFLKKSEIVFEDITPELLKHFSIYLKAKRKVSERTVQNHYVVIRTIYNRAIRANLVDQKFYPFGKGKITIRFPQTTKQGLTPTQLHALENKDYKKEPKKRHARNLFFMSFYFAGIRISDTLRLKWSDLKDGRLYYQMGKNQKVLSLKVPVKAKVILKEYRKHKKSPDDYIFPELKGIKPDDDARLFKTISNSTKTINKYLQLIAKDLEFDRPLTMHVSRHTFASLSGDKIPILMLKKLYRHSDINTTINYQNSFIYKDEDEALESVLDY